MFVRITAASCLLAASGAALAQQAPVSQAQVNQVDKRVGVLESQMRAVQRQVFPGGDKRYFAPEVTAPEPESATTGTPATPAIVDLTQRVTALETQQRQLTGQIETLQYQLRQLEESVKKQRADAEFRLDVLEGKNLPGAAPGAAETPAVPLAVTPPVANPPKATAPAATPPKTATSPTPTAPNAAAPAVPGTTTAAAPATAGGLDPVEARYRAGYQLYVDGKYPEAVTALNAFVAENPKSARASNAQYWSGRSLMSQGKTADAAKAFLAGYQKFPRGERAPNSLLWLGKSLIELEQPKAACQALDQLKTAYPDKLTGQFAADASAARAQAKCGG